MSKRRLSAAAAGVLILGAISFYGLQKWCELNNPSLGNVLGLMPSDANAAVFVNLRELRQAPFFAEVVAWAPQLGIDADYKQFLRETNFDYEKDLDRFAIATKTHAAESEHFAVAEGRFDRNKIEAYASKLGRMEKRSGKQIFSVPIGSYSRRISFVFLSNDRIALTDAQDLSAFPGQNPRNSDTAEWQTRFLRLAGTPIFAVIRQDASTSVSRTAPSTSRSLAERATAGMRFPEVSALVKQLQWITVAGKPENDRLRMVAEGECNAGSIVQQLTDLLNGVILVAQAGLNSAKMREQLDTRTREAYLELLRSMDVSQVDRGETKSVRLVFHVTPKLLEVARNAESVKSPTSPNSSPPGKIPTRK
ncbi:MAG TPA: hypothetical protein VOA64_07785 [Candidatus Dormibacteraeota bacterium]|nr:hypothetical protein [Candidatus Dormibacteraeota bacterium]